MKNSMKKTISVALAVLTTAALSVTAFAANYGAAPVFPSNPSVAPSVKNETLTEAVDAAAGATATVEVASVKKLQVSPSVMKKLAKAESGVLEIVSPKATISIDASTITKARKIDLSMKVYGKATRSVVKIRGNKDFGCEVKIAITSCKMSAEALANAHVYCNGEDLGPVELNEDGVPVITVTKGGTYEVK